MTKSLSASFVTLFPDLVTGATSHSMLGRAIAAGFLHVHAEQIRDYAHDKHHTVDDTPYGGGPGQLMRVDVVVRALRAAIEKDQSVNHQPRKTRIILTEPAGRLFTQADAKRLSDYDHLVFVCGRYEGIDARIFHYVDEAISIGDFILTGGELAALTIFDATSRYIPGVLGNEDSYTNDSFSDGLLEYSQYTRPMSFEGHDVPDVYQQGHHKKIALERRREQLIRTMTLRPDLFDKAKCTQDELAQINSLTNVCYPWMKKS